MQLIDSYDEILDELGHADIRDLYDATLSVLDPDSIGDYLLNVACERLQYENIEFFISKGASLETLSVCGDTPILNDIDCVGHNPEVALKVVELLLKSGANIEHHGYMDKTPFLKAYTRGELSMIKLLVESGCDVKAVAKDLGGTTNGLEFARMHGASVEVVNFVHRLLIA
ncbi:hypothetical protein V6233_20175 [Vibrio antiquarius]